MSITAESVFRSLSEDNRRALLERHSIPILDTFPEELEQTGHGSNSKLQEDLKQIGTLGADHGQHILHYWLTEAGWSHEDFARSISSRDRCCVLLCQYPELYADALSMWRGNKLRSAEPWECGFRTPELGYTYEFDAFTDPDRQKLTDLLKDCLKEARKSYSIEKIEFRERASIGLPTRSTKVLQLDILMGADPQSFEVIVDGEKTSVTLTLARTISVLIDLQAETLFVGMESGGKKLKHDIAQSAVQVVFRQAGELASLSPIRVFPEKCIAPPEFSFSSTDLPQPPEVTELKFGLFGAPGSFVGSFRNDDPDTDFYSLDLIASLKERMRIFQSKIDFFFPSGREGLHSRRTIALTSPSQIGFGNAFPEERMIIEKVLAQTGLIDAKYDWPELSGIDDIGRLITPQHRLEVEDSWRATTLESLKVQKIVRPGSPANNAFCKQCGQTHTFKPTKHDEIFIECGVEPRTTNAEALDTLILDQKRLKQWLAECLNITDKPSEFGQSNWFVGTCESSKPRGKFGLIICPDLEKPESHNDVVAYLQLGGLPEKGLVLSLRETLVTALPLKWKVTRPSAILKLKDKKLTVDIRECFAILEGSKVSKAHTTESDREQMRQLVEQECPPGKTYAHNTCANHLKKRTQICSQSQREPSETF